MSVAVTPIDPVSQTDRHATARRWFLQRCGIGLGHVALLNLLAERAPAASNPMAAKPPHFGAKVKNVILLFMGGGPSQFELWDHKPALKRLDGTLPPPELLEGYRAAFINPNSKLLGPKYSFSRRGECAAEVSELLPHTGGIVDDLCVVRSMKTDAFNHAPAQLMMSTGSQQFGRPSMGSWVTYGLGSESRDLPAFIVLNSGKKGPSAGSGNWNSGFLPTVHSGVEFRGGGEPAHVLDLYGAEPGKASFANNCLLARRLVERGVRFVELFHESWDQHGGLTKQIKANCEATDRPAAALITDLKRQGLLDETLVIWGGEFGRTPMVQGGNDGRDHHPNSFTMWMAGGGLKRGLVYGSTDELGFDVAENPVHVHDLHATILHLLGFDHRQLTYRFQGRDYRLTDVHGNVIEELLS